MAPRVRSGLAGAISRVLITTSLITTSLSAPAWGQSIAPAPDEAGPQVTIDRSGDHDHYAIQGGQRVGANLFQSFERLGLASGETATFWVAPDVSRVLARVVGGQASVIDGQLGLAGGSADLFLLNPAGIVFGPGARLDLPGSFWATTATAIGFGPPGQETLWPAIGPVANWASLGTEPTAFVFGANQSGSIANFGVLTVPTGATIALLGQSVLNRGTLAATGGQVTIAAIPGSQRLRLSQPGSLLSLEVDPWPVADRSPTNQGPVAASLPELLTGAGVTGATGVTIAPDGQIMLQTAPNQDPVALPSGPGLAIVSGQVSASRATAGTIGGQVTIMGDRLGLFGATVTATGPAGGGTVRLGGEALGGGPLFQSQMTAIDGHSSIDVSASDRGPSGRVLISAMRSSGLTSGIMRALPIETPAILDPTDRRSRQRRNEALRQVQQVSNQTSGNDLFQNSLLIQRLRQEATTAIDRGDLGQGAIGLDRLSSQQILRYTNRSLDNNVTDLARLQVQLRSIATTTQTQPAILYTLARPEQLDVVLVTGQGPPIYRAIKTINDQPLNAQKLSDLVKELRTRITDPNPISRRFKRYLPAARQLYDVLIRPIAPELERQKITTIAFAMDRGLRTLPVAALHDGERFLVERYSLGMIPGINLIDLNYLSLQNVPVLGFGASKFVTQTPLPAVPVELATITEKLKPGKSFLNEAFTLVNLRAQRRANPYPILHLATHADFQPGGPHNSYIQFWDQRLALDDLRDLQLDAPPINLLVLSACRTAIGDEGAELGFAGLAVQAGVKTALASLWSVSDEGTLGLMSSFYNDLRTAPTKVEALRQAQIEMLRGQTRLENGVLIFSGGQVTLPPELAGIGPVDLSHPYFWSAFTAIGSPW